MQRILNGLIICMFICIFIKIQINARSHDEFAIQDNIKKHEDKIVAQTSVVTNSVSLNINHYQEDNTEKTNQVEDIIYQSNSKGKVELALGYKSFGGAVSINVGAQKDNNLYGETKGKAFTLYYYSHSFGVDAFYINYKGYYLDDPEKYDYQLGDEQTIRSDLATESIGLNLYYCFNKKFPLDIAFNNAGRLANWDWAFLVMFSATHFKIKSDHSLIPLSQRQFYNKYFRYSGGEHRSLAVVPGIATILPCHNFIFSGGIFMGAGIMESKDNIINTEESQVHFFTKINLKLGMSYDVDDYFYGLMLHLDTTNTEDTSKEEGVSTTLNVGTVKLFAGVRI